jgi:ATP-dependent helicase/nuclease subunit B
MATIDRYRIAPEAGTEAAWAEVVSCAQRWTLDRGIALRDAVLLVPFAQLLPPARRAWARAGGWMPRIETTQTLARALAPSPRRTAGEPMYDVATDRLAAAALLRTQSWARDWERRDARRFEHAVGAVVDVAHALGHAAAAQPPQRREAWWNDARALLARPAGVAGTETALALVALEWAASGCAPATDALFALRPAAWIVVQAGGSDALAQALAEHAACPALVVDADVDPGAPFERGGGTTSVEAAVCDDAEDEAQRAASQVLACLRDGRTPVALIAQDRSLVRRVHALLARRRVPVQDETGWRLSTTRAAARVMTLLRAMRGGAGSDDLVDALKTSAPAGVDALERALRRARCTSLRGVDALPLSGDAAALWSRVAELRAGFAQPARRSLLAWLGALDAALQAFGDRGALDADAAGRQVLAALQLDAAAPAGAMETVSLTLDAFIGWIDTALEHAAYVPTADAPADVVITPLARAMLRPFAAIVLAGADERRLGGAGAAWPLLGDCDAAALGLPDAARRRERETLAFAQLLRAPALVLLRRRRDGSEPLAASVLWQRLVLAWQRRGLALSESVDVRERETVVAAPLQRPAPAAAALLPAALSASAVESLRACPYRFHALVLLRLRESDELDDAVEKRHYGEWLHAVLHRFHAERERPASRADEIAALRRIALAQRADAGLDEAAFVPYAASFERFAPRYVDWLHARDRSGARWQEGEVEIEAAPPALGGTVLRGRIDRIDSVAGDGGRTLQLIDYKTGSATKLRSLVRQRTEDTQLAFYAALVGAARGGADALQAAYLPLDETEAIEALAHDDVAATAVALVDGLAHDLARLRGGAGLPALGEGASCEYCAARGLCRRDDWSTP